MPKVLIVDDEPDNIELMTRRLARRGFDCIGATTAVEGIAFAKTELPNVILMDIKMPVMDGLEATRQLKADAATKGIPVIALTAHAMAEDRERAMAAGADEYESKPVDLAQLLLKIETLTRGPVNHPTPAEIATADANRRMWQTYLQAELTAPSAALAEASLKLQAKCENPLFLELRTSVERIRDRAIFVQHTVESVVSDTEKNLDRRALRHDLRGAVGYILSACEDLAESTTREQAEILTSELSEVSQLARRTIGLIESVVKYSPDEQGEIRKVFDRHRKEVERVRTSPDRIAPGQILLIDDSEFQRDLLAKMLREQGHTVEIAAGAAIAQKRLESEYESGFDLILCDVLMPGVSGLEFLRWVKSHKALWQLPVLMVSALEDEEGVLACIMAGAEDYLTRPVKSELLQARIAGCLEMKRLRDRESVYQARIDRLVQAMFPPAMIEEWRTTETIRPRRHDKVGILFTDIVGFTTWCEGLKDNPESVVNSLQDLIARFESAALRHGVQKIKTIGDAFMAVAGLNNEYENPAFALVNYGKELIRLAKEHTAGWTLRVGVHVGPVVTGILGQTQFTFDVWGQTVNAASRMESNGRAGHVTLSSEAWQDVCECFSADPREVVVKGLGPTTVWDVR